MGELPEAVTVSAAFREAISTIPERSTWNPNTSRSIVPRDFLVPKELVRHCITIFVRFEMQVIANLMFVTNCHNDFARRHRSKTNAPEQALYLHTRKNSVLGTSVEDHSSD
jgi:hypothetical protein